MSRKRALAETDANVAHIEVPKKTKMADKESKESPAVLKIAAALLASLAKTRSDATPLTETEDVLSDATASLQPLKKNIRSDNIHFENAKEVEDEKKAHGCKQKGKSTDTGPAVANLGNRETMTAKGLELAQEWATQQEKRCQDNYNMHIFNDWNGYRISEVIENIFLAFAKVAKKTYSTRKRPDKESVMAIWAHIESAALFLNGLERQDNAKRIMLVGSMLLYVLDLFEKLDLIRGKGADKLLRNDSAELPSLGLVIGLFINFAEYNKEICKLNEDGWKFVVVEKAISYGLDVHNIKGTENIIEAMETGRRTADKPKEIAWRENREESLRSLSDDLTHCMACYKREELWGLITMETLNRGTRRSWSSYSFYMELDAYKANQAVKVGPEGPEYRDNIGGKFYDLTAQRNKGTHMHQYRL